MGKRNKLWLSMQAATLAGLTTLSACSMDEGEDATENEESSAIEQQAAPLSAYEGEGGEGGEGEGEGAAAAADPATDDIAYLTQLSLIRGHLLVGHKLFQEGHIDQAKTHMKHPKSELYAAIEPAFSARSAVGFATELQALANAVSTEQSPEQVAEIYTQLLDTIARSESVVAENSQQPAARLQLAVELLRVAGEEYAIAVVDGEMQNAHEYQDAFGFTQVAIDIIDNTAATNEVSNEALKKAQQILSGLSPLWPSTIPPETLETEAGQLYGAAARIEILALGLK